MTIKDQILDLIVQGEAAQKDVIAAIPEETRRGDGRLDAWAPKDVLLHITSWMRVLVTRLSGGEAPAVSSTPEEVDLANRRIFEANAGVPWDDVVPSIEAVHADLAAVVRAFNEQDLRSTSLFAWQRDQPVWGSITGSVIVHPTMHLAQILLDLGQHESAHALQERMAERLSELDPGPRWRGVVRYNLACHYALAGERERSLALLAEALSLHPGLRAWSGEDADLTSLHGDPEFARLTDMGGGSGDSPEA